jgi:hypothetical protein
MVGVIAIAQSGAIVKVNFSSCDCCLVQKGFFYSLNV